MKNHFPLILLAACLGALWPLSSCEPAPEDPEYYLDQETLDYCYFKKGSWWTYNGTNGQTDSVWVFESSKGLVDMKLLYGAYVESMGITTKSQLKKGTTSWQSEICISENNYPEKGFAHHLYGSLSDSWRVFYVYFDDSETNVLTCGQSGSGATFLEKYEEWDRYENVKIFESTHSFENNPEVIYWAKNIGIIKQVMTDGTEWTLQRYHVIQ